MAYDIFISYRREGGKDKARALKGELELKKFNVFLDFDELKDGKFDKRIMDAIDQASVFIFLMTPHSLDRCVNEDDWVRKEIEYATKKEKTILPVNVDMEFSEFPQEIPASIKEALGAHTFVDIHFGSTFKDLVEKMVNERINAVIRKHQQKADQPKDGAEIHINTDANCNIYDYGEKIGVLEKGDNVIYLKRGRHKLQFKQTLSYSSFLLSFYNSNKELSYCIEKEYNITTDIDYFDLNFTWLHKKDGWKRILSSISFYNYIVAISALIISIIGSIWCLIDDGFNNLHYQLGIIGICAAIYFIILKYCKHIFDEEWELSSGGIWRLVFYWVLIIFVPIGLTIFIYELFLLSESIFDTDYIGICCYLVLISSAILIYLSNSLIREIKNRI